MMNSTQLTPRNSKGTKRSQCEMQCELQYKIGQEGNTETNERKETEDKTSAPRWLVKFTDWLEANKQPNAEAADHPEGISDNLYKFVISDEWQKVEHIYQTYSNLKTTDELNSQGDTALHVAVNFDRKSIFNGLMNLMTPEDLEVLDKEGNTAFFVCASSGKVNYAQAMLKKNKTLPMISGNDDLLPIHIAAIRGHRQMLQLLCQAPGFDDRRSKRRDEQIDKLFFTTLENNIFDVGCALLNHSPRLANRRNKGGLTGLHVLARKPQREFSTGSCRCGLELIRRLWTAATFMDRSGMSKLIRKPSNMLFDAAKSGNTAILDLVFESNPELLMDVDSNKRNLFHIAALNRQDEVLIHLKEERILADFLMLAVDEDDNNVLHLAGKSEPLKSFGSPRPLIQMQRELQRFQELGNEVPSELKAMRNREGCIPEDVFYKCHEQLHGNATMAAKDTANSGMLVATIIATIVFAAALTVPGHDVSPNADSSVLQRKGWYIIFILSNSIALFASSSSMFYFLSVLTSSFAQHEFKSSLQARLMCGVIALFAAITATVVAFTATCFLIFNHLSAWVAYLVASFGSITVALFVFLLRSLFGDLIRSLYSSRHHFFGPAIINFPQKMKDLTSKLPKMSQIAKPKKQEDSPMAEA